MGRPKRVYPKSLPKYDKLHTRKVKMMCGTEITALHLIKETDQFYMGFESWAYCCGNFRHLKYGFDLRLDIPVITDGKTVEFLNGHAWKDWVDRQLKESKKPGEMESALKLLDKVFPDKKKVYFYELDSIIASFCHGNFISYDDKGIIEEPSEHDIKQRKYYSSKYKRFCHESDEIKALYEAYSKIDEKNKKEKNEAFTKYYDAEQDYIFKHYNKTEMFIEIGKNSVVCPYAFENETVKGSSYEYAGEIYFVVTPDAVYFEIKRHF